MIDTLTLYYVLPTADSVVGWEVPAKSATEIYGPISSLSLETVTSTVALAGDGQIAPSWQSATAIVLLLVMFCYAIYRFGALARASFKSIVSLSDTEAMFENSTLEFNRFIIYGRYLFLLAVAIIIDGLFFVANGASLIVVGVIIGGFILGSMISSVMIKILSLFDYNEERWTHLRSIKKIDRSLAGIIFSLPAIAFSYAQSTQVVLYVLLGVVVGLHFFRILIFFRQRGFSFLQWILYLCAVEIAPFAFLWGVAVRL